MSEKGHENTGLYTKDEARNEAMLIQAMLYQWKAAHLRDSKSFSAIDYEHASETADLLKKIRKDLSALPPKGFERTEALHKLLGTYPVAGIVIAWREHLESEYPKSKEYEKFASYSGPIFWESDRAYFEAESDLDAGVFNYGAASQFYMVLAHRLYEKISGQPYLSPQELKYNFEEALKGKEILELAPGPGWFMKTLKGMGANVIGLEKAKHESFKGTGMSDLIGKGDATDLEFIFGKNKFDIILSNNFLNFATIDKKQATKIVRETLATLKEGGLAVHATQLFVRPDELRLLNRMVEDPKHVNYYLDQLAATSHQGNMGAEDIPIVDTSLAIKEGAVQVEDGHETGYYYLNYKK